MKTSTNRTVRSSLILGTFVAVLLFIAAPTTLLAQQQDADEPKSLKEHLKKKQQELREKAGIEEDQQQAPLQQSGIDLGSLTGPYAIFEKDQSWMFGNPGGSFKTPLTRSGQWAGDINKNGTPDFVVRSEPDGPETIVYYGGNTTTDPDQVLDVWLSPVGDINGDGHADAVTGYGQIYYGSDTGYESSSENIPQTGLTNGDFSGTTGILIPAGDLDGDGIDDVILKRSNFSSVPEMVVYWGNDSGDALQNFREYDINGPDLSRSIGDYTANTADFDGDNQQEIYTFGRDYQSDTTFVKIFDLDSNKDIQVAQDFDVSINTTTAESQYAINVMDLNNDGFEEIFIRPAAQFQHSSNYVLLEDENNAGDYDAEPVDIFNGMAWPVGDLDDDGYIDFHVGDPDNDDAPHIAYGSDTITDGFLSLDDHVTLASSETWRYYYNVEFPYLSTGDIDGDGIDDYVLGFRSEDNDQIGRAFVYGNDSGSPVTDKSLTNRIDFLDSYNGITNVGDVNGDDIEDFAINRTSSETIEIYYGGSSISDQPDVTLDADYTFDAEGGGSIPTTALGIIGGDFNGDGVNDIAVSDNYGVYVHIYLGGESLDGEPDHVIKGSDFSSASSNSAFYFIQDIGDVNDDGIDDFIIGSQLATNENDENLNEAYLFLGDDSSLPNSPDQVISLADPGNYIDGAWKAANIGDYNGDGINDFAVSSPQYENPSSNNIGKVDVFYGNSSGDFSSPDITLKPSGNDLVNGFGYSLAGGDFTGDGAGDVAVGKQSVQPQDGSSVGESNIEVFLGGEDRDTEVDHHLTIDPESVGSSGSFLPFFNGTLETIDDHDGNGMDEIIALDYTNAVVFGGNFSVTSQQTSILEGHNTRSALGNVYGNAVGDFTGNGSPDVIAQQSSRESNYIDVAHRYGIPKPISIASVEDVPEDQGGWVRVTADGYYMDGLDADIIGFDHWAVWRQSKEDSDKWVNVGTVPAYGESADYIDVHVPKTKSTGSDDDAATYDFKITAENKDETDIAVSNVTSGYALDNISPDAVSGITADRNNNQVNVSWDPSNANDLNTYEIVSDENPDEPLATASANQNNATLSDSEFNGVQKISVRARDLHENASEMSETALAVFQTDLSYEVNSNWNLIGIPLDADQDEVSSLLSNVEGDKLYEFDGKYNKVDESDVEPGKGYWAKFSSDENYGVSGLPLVNLTLELDEGWNLISGVGASVNVDQIKDSDNILIDGTLRSFDGAYQEESAMQPAGGYWIRASESGSVTLSLTEDEAEQTQAKDSKPKMSEVKDELSKVMISSSADYESTLYFGDELPEHVDSRSFSMPPVAPGKTFDVRYAGNGMNYVEGNDFTVDIEKQEQVNDVTVELDLNNNPKNGSFKVQEKKGTEVIAEYMLENETAVTLKNSDVTSVTFSSGNEDIAQQDMPEKFEMSPSYPNPFNPSTTIKYQIPEQVDVNVDVYNMAGKKVRTLVAGEQQEAGTHTIRFNASDLSSGIYFVQMRAGSFEHVQKITLIK